MLHVRIEALASLPGALYSVTKAVPGFLQVSDLWRWTMNAPMNRTRPNVIRLFHVIAGVLESRSAFAAATFSNSFNTSMAFRDCYLIHILSGSTIDRATLQLVGTLFASTLVPGLVGALV
eukprot:5161985-Amphidinium_carterae.1